MTGVGVLARCSGAACQSYPEICSPAVTIAASVNATLIGTVNAYSTVIAVVPRFPVPTCIAITKIVKLHGPSGESGTGLTYSMGLSDRWCSAATCVFMMR